MRVPEIEGYSGPSDLARSNDLVPAAIALNDVVRPLCQAKIGFVVVGENGLARWRKDTRTNGQIEVIVKPQSVGKATRTLAEAFSELKVVKAPLVVRFHEAGVSNYSIRIIKPLMSLDAAIPDHARLALREGERFRIPSLEMALVMMFDLMTNLYSAAELKHLAAHDFIRIVRVNRHPDETKLAGLAALLYPKAERDILNKIRAARADSTLSV